MPSLVYWQHERCLEAIQTQCFLHTPSVSAALHRIFEICLTFCRLLSDADTGIREERAREEHSAVTREFARQSNFLFAYLSNISSPSASPHLSQLLLRLNFNNFFIAERKMGGEYIEFVS